MDIAFVVDPLDTIKPYKDSSYAMMREAAARNHRVFAVMQHEIALSGSRIVARTCELKLTGDEDDWYRVASEAEIQLAQFGAVLMRKDPPFNMEYVYSTYLLELAEQQGARVYNRPRSLRDFNEKLAVAYFPEFAAPTLVTREDARIRAFLAEHGDIVLKPLDGMGGSSVFRVRQDDPNVGVIIETLTQFGAKTAMAQRYIPDIVKGDKRVLVIDGKAVPFSLARIPAKGESRGNLAAGATGVAQPLSKRDLEIAEGVAAKFRGLGLLIVGLDVIGEYLTEINVTSPTCMREILDQKGFNSAAWVIDALERSAK